MRDSLSFLAAGFIVVWIVLGVYLFRLWFAQRDLTSRLARLEGNDPKPVPENPDTVG